MSHFGGSVDPFGTLRHLRAEYVKLDSSFVQNLESDPSKLDRTRSS